MIATHEGILNIADIEIPCYVLKDATRVLSGRMMQEALNLTVTPKGGGDKPGSRLSRLLNDKSINSLLLKEKSPDHTKLKSVDHTKLAELQIINFRYKGKTIHGYQAETLAFICDVMLEARRQGLLRDSPRKQIVATQCEILMRSFAKVGIIALIDEATGYQYDRARDALNKILDEFITKELRGWTKTFPDEFYKEMFRLRGWHYIPFSVKRPSVVGRYTNDLVYERIAPGILEELKRKNPTVKPGRRKHKHFQWLTEQVGHPRLREHLTAVIALMKASNKWDKFYRLLQRALPKYGEQMEWGFDDELEERKKSS